MSEKSAYVYSRVIFLVVLFNFTAGFAFSADGALPPCAGSLNVSRFRFLLIPVKGGAPLPLQQVNVVDAGQKLKYEPLHIPPAVRDKAKIALILVAAHKPGDKADATGKVDFGEEGVETAQSLKNEQKQAKQDIHVLAALAAKDSQEWTIPARATVVGIVYGPHGLDMKKVGSMVVKNPDLIPELTEYAEQTEKVGALVETLAEYQQQPDPDKNLNAALSGFGSTYNIAVPKLDATQPASAQATVLMQAMMPSLSNYDPITQSSAGVVAQSAGLAGAVATMFFGSPVGLAAGGAALVLNLRTLVFPDTDFRSAFAQPFQTTGLALCAKNEPEKARTRVAYLWMMKVPNAEAPPVALPATAYLPIGGKSTIKVPFKKADESRLLARAHGWELVSATSHADVPVKVQAGTPDDTLDIDLTQTKLPAGDYHLAALWDWEPLQVKGDVDLRPLADFSKAKVVQQSADHLVTGTGTVKVELTGADFEFVNKVAMAKAGDKRATPKEILFTLPKGLAQGDQESLEVEVDTSTWDAGSYHLILTQSNGSSHDVPLVIHPPNPTLENLPYRANIGDTQQTVLLQGTWLERIARITTPGAAWELAPVKTDQHDLKQRKATVKLQAGEHPDDVLTASVFVQDIESPLVFNSGLKVAGPRPKIASFTLSLAQQPDVQLAQGEIPAGAATSFSLSTLNAGAHPTLSLACANAGFLRAPLELHPGDRTPNAQLDFAGDSGLFLSVDPGAVGLSGCQLAAVISTDETGSSDPVVLGRVIRLPRIEKLSLSDDKVGSTLYGGSLTGVDLQMIEKTGWDAKTSYPVQGIPTTVPVQGTPDPNAAQEQTLKIELSWPPPSPHAPIYVWLRGESTGRLTDVKY